MKTILKFFDKFEDVSRTKLSKRPILYAIIGGFCIVLFWRAVWIIADQTPLISNPYVSLFLSISVLLATGLFTAFFIGDSILISGIKGEKKLIEKTDLEIKKEGSALFDIKTEMETEMVTLKNIQDELRELRTLVDNLGRQ